MNGAQSLQGLILPLGLLVVFYLFIIKPQKKREKEVKDMREGLRAGDEVITIGGIYGKIVKIKEDYLTIEVGSSKNKIDITKWAIGSVTKKNESKNSKNQDDAIEDNKTDNE